MTIETIKHYLNKYLTPPDPTPVVAREKPLSPTVVKTTEQAKVIQEPTWINLDQDPRIPD